MTIPPYLKKGDTIGITCPAGYMDASKAQTCIETLQNWGYNVKIGTTLGSKSKTYFSGTDDERRAELQTMLDDENIKAILCGRGGYGVGKIIDNLNFDKFLKSPKWVIGFSDITVLHCHIVKKLKVATLHAPMAAAFNDNGFKNIYIKSLQNALVGKKANYTHTHYLLNKIGLATGRLIGGNLTLVTNMMGSKDEIKTKDKILFLEDIGEQLYDIDRKMSQLKRAGKLDNLAGIIFGVFSDCKDTDRPFGKKIQTLLYEYVKDYDYPICFNFPVSHNKENYALKCGIEYSLRITKTLVRLKEV